MVAVVVVVAPGATDIAAISVAGGTNVYSGSRCEVVACVLKAAGTRSRKIRDQTHNKRRGVCCCRSYGSASG